MQDNLVRMMPQDIEAEENVLGAVLILPESINEILPVCGPDDFYRETNRTLFKACVSLYEAKEPIDGFTLKKELEKTGFENLGSTIATLTERVPTAANGVYYAKRVKEKSNARKLLAATYQIQSEIHAGELDTKELFDSAEHKIFKATQGRQIQEFSELKNEISKTFDHVHALADRSNPLTGIESSFLELDSYTSGFQKAELIIIGARPGSGKTSLALNIAEHVSTHGKNVAFFSLEMTQDQLLLRLFCSCANVHLNKRGKTFFTEEETERICLTASKLSQVNFLINDSSFLSILELKALARRAKEQNKIDIIFVDYLQLIHAGIQTQNREQEVSYISRHLKALAKDLNIPVVVLAQLSRPRKGEEDKKPYLSDLRESGAIEQDADVVIFLHKTEDMDNHQVIVAKQRNGATGSFFLQFNAAVTRFEKFTPVQEVAK